MVSYFSWCQGTQAQWCNKLLSNTFQYGARIHFIHHSVAQRERQHLIRSKARIVSIRSIDYIIQVASKCIPEALIETQPAASAFLRIDTRGMREPSHLVEKLRPLIHQAKRVVPQCIHLDRLPITGSDRFAIVH